MIASTGSVHVQFQVRGNPGGLDGGDISPNNLRIGEVVREVTRTVRHIHRVGMAKSENLHGPETYQSADVSLVSKGAEFGMLTYQFRYRRQGLSELGPFSEGRGTVCHHCIE